MRKRFGTAASRSCVNAPNAHIRPQYNRPQITVETREKPANRYQATLYLNSGRFKSTTRKMSVTEIIVLLVTPRYATVSTSVVYFSALLRREKLKRANPMRPAV